ncbi:MAG TPA: CDP-alcohol phosphatidyltransferase family protein [Humisphaera sp.]|nr:CDP-alcohol phosphatidyltransferase family protein [Humisphaera sp.]
MTRRLRIAATIPWLLVLVRLLLAPLIIVISHRASDRTILLLYLLGFATDYFDGVIARRLKTDTPLLRKSDGAVDTVFHLALAFITIQRHPEEFRKSLLALTIFIVSAATWYILDAIRWRRLAGFHSYSAKLFSIGLLVWMIALYGGHATGRILSVVLLVGVYANIEGILISLLLKQDRPDVPTFVRAIRKPAE